jgi:hypothetical protein
MGTDGRFRTNRERRSKENNETNVLPESLAWDAMIRDAKKRIEELKLAIELFEKKKAAGERWPPAQSRDQGAAQQHAV